MFQAGFGFDKYMGLIPLEGDPKLVCGGVTAQVISHVYEAWLPELVGLGDIFMHDGASVHTARIIRRLLNEMELEVMVWLLYSPDLNPIENLWALIKAVIYERYPELERAPDTQETLDCLIKAAKEAWHATDERVLQNLSNTMPHRVQAILSADGWYTKYQNGRGLDSAIQY